MKKWLVIWSLLLLCWTSARAGNDIVRLLDEVMALQDRYHQLYPDPSVEQITEMNSLEAEIEQLLLDFQAHEEPGAMREAVTPEAYRELLDHEGQAFLIIQTDLRDGYHLFLVRRKQLYYRYEPAKAEWNLRESTHYLNRALHERSSAESWKSEAFALHQVLISPWGQYLDGINHLVVMSSFDIPFPALLQELPEPELPMDEWSFLIRKYAISHFFSMKQRRAQVALEPLRESRIMLEESLRQRLPVFPAGMESDKARGLEGFVGNTATINMLPLSPEEKAMAWKLQSWNRQVLLLDCSGEQKENNLWDRAAVAFALNNQAYAVITSPRRSRVSEQTDANIWGHIVQNLAAREQLDQALRHAQLSYLQSAKGEAAHPYYWANWKVYGNVKPAVRLPDFPWIWLVIGGFILVILLGKKL